MLFYAARFLLCELSLTLLRSRPSVVHLSSYLSLSHLNITQQHSLTCGSGGNPQPPQHKVMQGHKTCGCGATEREKGVAALCTHLPRVVCTHHTCMHKSQRVREGLDSLGGLARAHPQKEIRGLSTVDHPKGRNLAGETLDVLKQNKKPFSASESTPSLVSQTGHHFANHAARNCQNDIFHLEITFCWVVFFVGFQ